MIKEDFWGHKHGSGQSFINKWDCARQVNLINAEVVVALSGSFSMSPQTLLHFSVFFLGSLEAIVSLANKSLNHIGKRAFDHLPCSEVKFFQRGPSLGLSWQEMGLSPHKA